LNTPIVVDHEAGQPACRFSKSVKNSQGVITPQHHAVGSQQTFSTLREGHILKPLTELEPHK